MEILKIPGPNQKSKEAMRYEALTRINSRVKNFLNNTKKEKTKFLKSKNALHTTALLMPIRVQGKW